MAVGTQVQKHGNKSDASLKDSLPRDRYALAMCVQVFWSNTAHYMELRSWVSSVEGDAQTTAI
jgi:hypothetical protein